MITFEKARIVGNAQITGLQLTNKLRVVTIVDEKIAKMLGVQWMLFDSKGIIRPGAHDFGLDNDYNGAVFTHEIPRLGKLQLEAVQATKFQVKRLGDGKKKPKKLMLVFQVIYSGAHLELQEHLIKMGKGDGIVTIVAPEQLQLGNQEGGTLVDMSPAPAGADPIKKDYSSKRGWSANITVTAVADGFEVTRRANSPSKKLKQGPPAKFGSEQEALEEGALDINRWATKIGTSGTRPEKREAVKLIEWCYGISNRDGAANLLMGAEAGSELVNPVQAAREYPD